MKTLWRKNQENPSDRISHAWAMGTFKSTGSDFHRYYATQFPIFFLQSTAKLSLKPLPPPCCATRNCYHLAPPFSSFHFITTDLKFLEALISYQLHPDPC